MRYIKAVKQFKAFRYPIHPDFLLRLKRKSVKLRRKRGIGNCGDCGDWNDVYMATQETWDEAKAGPHDLLCLNCLTKRLGRPLTEEDFNTSSINNPVREGIRIGIQIGIARRGGLEDVYV